MASVQPSLFDRKHYTAVMPQTFQIDPPTADSTILKTLPAFHAYLASGEYSKYTPDDFTSDVKKFGLFVKEKKLREIRKADIQQWIGELKKNYDGKVSEPENLSPHELFSLAGERESSDS